MGAIVESAPVNEVARSSQANSARNVEAAFGSWLPPMAVVVGALLSVVWTASLLGLSLWALSLLV
jgi:hypothetical protein